MLTSAITQYGVQNHTCQEMNDCPLRWQGNNLNPPKKIEDKPTKDA